MVDEEALRPNHVAHGNDRKGEVEPLAGLGIDGGGTGGAVTGADHVGTDDTIPVRIQQAPGADDGVPPPRFRFLFTVFPGQVGAPGPCVGHEDCVIPLLVQLTVSLVGERDRPEDAAALQLEIDIEGNRFLFDDAVVHATSRYAWVRGQWTDPKMT